MSLEKDPHPSCYNHLDGRHHSSSSYYKYYNYHSVPLCPPVFPATAESGYPKPANNTACLQKCFDSRCPERNSSRLCDAVVDCYWCLKNKDNLPLEKPYCASSDRCFRGKESSITGKFQFQASKCSTPVDEEQRPNLSIHQALS